MNLNFREYFKKVVSLMANSISFCIVASTQLVSFFVCSIAFSYHFIHQRFTNKKVRKLKEKLRKTQDYEEWKELAKELDRQHLTLGWLKDKNSRFYDSHNIQLMITHLHELVRNNKIQDCAHLLRVLMVRNFSGIANQELYNYSLSGTKDLIGEYYETILFCLKTIYLSEMPGKLTFFKDLKHIYGKTSLMFSGGASIGMFHLGVISVLLEHQLLPSIFCGSSAGSLICSLVGTNSDEELLAHSKNDFTTLNLQSFKYVSPEGHLLRKIKRVFREGHFINKGPLRDFLIANTFNLTFEEAFQKTKRAINITVTDSHHQKFHVLNYLSSPNVYVWSAALASCSLPYVYAPTKIYAKFDNQRSQVWMPSEKLFIDGSIGADIPDRLLAEKFNVTNFIVSQTNVYIVPFLMNSRFYRFSRRFFLWRIWEVLSGFLLSEMRHRMSQLYNFGLIPRKYLLLINILMQEYTGQVTIFPNLKFLDAYHLLDNPSAAGIKEWTLRGRTSTFFSDLKSFKTNI